MPCAAGTFDVKLTPLAPDGIGGDQSLGRMSITKQFHGEMEGSSQGEMLTAGTSVKGSAGYVAMEKFIGSVAGRKGSFILQHTATMNRSAPQLSITVVPDSGTDELAGIQGRLGIEIADGKHSYEFDYSIG